MHRLLTATIARRADLFDSNTNAVRLIDGRGDGLPRIYVETFAGRWLVSTTGGELPPEFCEWFRDQKVSCLIRGWRLAADAFQLLIERIMRDVG